MADLQRMFLHLLVPHVRLPNGDVHFL
jgi:hypothetical protein